VFVSAPTTLNAEQVASRAIVMSFLDELNLEPRALGRSDYPSELPLREVLLIAKHCAGGIILGYLEARARKGGWRAEAQTKGDGELPDSVESTRGGNSLRTRNPATHFSRARHHRRRVRPWSHRCVHPPHSGSGHHAEGPVKPEGSLPQVARQDVGSVLRGLTRRRRSAHRNTAAFSTSGSRLAATTSSAAPLG
jgi:hypothetical protein